MPALRDGPPYLMTESIAAEPALAERLVARLEQSSAVDGLARLLRTTAMRGEPVVVTGCGTSEHAALGVVEILRDAWRTAKLPALGGGAAGPVAAQAFELSLDPPTGGLVIGVSHEGGTTATNAALAAARAAGARTALITVSGRSPGAGLAEVVVETGELDLDWCHTIGYVSPLIAAAVLGARVTRSSVSGRRSGPGSPTASRRRCARRPTSPPDWVMRLGSWSSRRAWIGRQGASWCSSSRRRPGCRRRIATSRRSSTATCHRSTPRRRWS